jgi:uncharacterized Tic20 family protein
MSQERMYRQFLLETENRIAPQKHAKPRFQESIDTFILGFLACAVGVVVLIVVLFGIAGRPVSDWFKISRYPQPSIACAVAAVAGEVLGLAGIALAWIRRRTISLFSTVGSAMCVLNIILFSIYELSINLFAGAR